MQRRPALPPGFPDGPWVLAWFSQGYLWCHWGLWEHLPWCFASPSPRFRPCRNSCRPWLRRTGTVWSSARWWCRPVWRWFPSAVQSSLSAASLCFSAPLPDSRSSARAAASRGNWRRRSEALPGKCSASHRPSACSHAGQRSVRKNTTIPATVRTSWPAFKSKHRRSLATVALEFGA